MFGNIRTSGSGCIADGRRARKGSRRYIDQVLDSWDRAQYPARIRFQHNFVILRPAFFAGRRIYASCRQDRCRRQISQVSSTTLRAGSSRQRTPLRITTRFFSLHEFIWISQPVISKAMSAATPSKRPSANCFPLRWLMDGTSVCLQTIVSAHSSPWRFCCGSSRMAK